MLLGRKIADGNGMWELRVRLVNGRTARVLFCIYRRKMVLLCGFVKKSDKMTSVVLNLATMRIEESQ